MKRDLMELILPRLAKRLNRHLRRYRSGNLDEKSFSQCFEHLLQQQHSWLANRGFPELDAAMAVHAAVLVLSGPGLRAEAEEESVPLEIVEYRAVRAAAADVAENFGVSERNATKHISLLVASYAD
ncbi:MAG: hypothetical protein U0840_07515 [Gemmataceae bacterium]